MKKFELDITDNNIRATIYNDVLDRNKELIMLAKLLSSQNHNLMLSLDGSWGSGKTFFIKQFEFLIKNIDSFTDNQIFSDADKSVFKKLKDSNLVIYYNAWENDNHEEPLESIMYNILNEFPSQKRQIVSFEKFKEVVKGFARDILNVASLQTFDINHFDKLDSYEDITKVIITSEEKHQAFDKLINDLLVKDQRLILIVDELDRCKPTFAVRLLETLKHFYNNDKITILVATNNKELSHTIKKFYGNEFDGYGYLSKFYDAILSLEIKDIKKYLRFQLDFCKSTFFPHEISYTILKYFNFSLRECNKYVSLYNLLRNYIENEPIFAKSNHYIFNNILLPLAIALKIKNVDLFRAFMSNKGKDIINDVLDSFNDNLVSWVKEMIGSGKDYKNIIIDYYESIFADNDSTFNINFHKMISLLGSEIYLENS